MHTAYQKQPHLSAVDHVVESIKKLLLSGELKPGDQLPNEGELAELLGVSRGSVRSAMKVFSAYGLVDIRVGDGTYVCTEINHNSLNSLIFPMLILQPHVDVLAEFREKVEIDIIELILSDDQRRLQTVSLLTNSLQELRELQSSATPLERFVENDLNFHRILARQSGNIVFETIYNQLLEYFIPFIAASHKHQEAGTAADSSHAKICRALEQNDLSLAQRAILDSNEYWRHSVVYSPK